MEFDVDYLVCCRLLHYIFCVIILYVIHYHCVIRWQFMNFVRSLSHLLLSAFALIPRFHSNDTATASDPDYIASQLKAIRGQIKIKENFNTQCKYYMHNLCLSRNLSDLSRPSLRLSTSIINHYDSGARRDFSPKSNSPFPQIDIIGAVVIVWRVRGKTIRSVLCNIVCNNCAQCNAHTYEQT